MPIKLQLSPHFQLSDYNFPDLDCPQNCDMESTDFMQEFPFLWQILEVKGDDIMGKWNYEIIRRQTQNTTFDAMLKLDRSQLLEELNGIEFLLYQTVVRTSSKHKNRRKSIS